MTDPAQQPTGEAHLRRTEPDPAVEMAAYGAAPLPGFAVPVPTQFAMNLDGSSQQS